MYEIPIVHVFDTLTDLVEDFDYSTLSRIVVLNVIEEIVFFAIFQENNVTVFGLKMIDELHNVFGIKLGMYLDFFLNICDFVIVDFFHFFHGINF